jgi:hypothetical protein
MVDPTGRKPMLILKPGVRLRSAVDSTEVVVVRAPSDGVQVSCGGAAMIGMDEEPLPGSPDPQWSGGTSVGKRYGSEALGIELLCTKAGPGSLAVNGTALEPAQAKPLPATD